MILLQLILRHFLIRLTNVNQLKKANLTKHTQVKTLLKVIKTIKKRIFVRSLAKTNKPDIRKRKV